jgi:hypothetical protein
VWTRWERREKRAERVALGSNFVISLGMPSGPGALPVPSELTFLSNVSRAIMSARVREGSPRGSMTDGSRLPGCSHGGTRSSGGVAGVSSLSKCEWAVALTSCGEATMAVSRRVILRRFEVALLWGRRPLFI